jgi:hypothetical protein
MKKRIVELVDKLDDSLKWVKHVKAFVNSTEAEMSQVHGTYTAAGLFSELKIRAYSLSTAGVVELGMNDLMDDLKNREKTQIIRTCVFRKNH